MGRKISIIKKGGVFVGIQQAAGCWLQGTSFKLQMLKSKFSGLDWNIIYKAQISLFTCHLERNAVNRVAAAAAVAGGAVVVVSLLQIHLC